MKAFRKTSPLIAAALAVAFGPALAQEEPDIAALKRPQSQASVGLGYVDSNNQRFGQYSGLTDRGAYLLLDADAVRRDDESGTWLRFSGRNVGLDSRELRFSQERQGSWGYYVDFSQIPRFDPFTVNTGLRGIGTTTQTPATIAPGTGAEYHLQMERQRWTLGGEKALAPGLSAQVRFRTEDKKGDRLWGQGTFGTWRFLADPVDQTTNQLDATLSYTSGKLQLVGGYYGTRFSNRNNVLTVNAPVLFAGSNQMSLPPDNFSHQLHLTGGYNFTPMTRGTFKLARGTIRQEEAFWTTPLAAGAPFNLGGRVDTTLLQAGLLTRPTAKTTIRADLRYDDRHDKTPTFIYYPSQRTATSTNNGENEPRNINTKDGKVDATYQLLAGFRLGGGVEVVEKTRNSPPVRSVGFRETTDENIYNVNLRRAIGETATGSMTLLHSKRYGSDFLTNTFFGGAVYSNAIAPLHLADRDRDTARFVLNWTPTEPLAINFRTDLSRDSYSGRTTTGFELGPRKGTGQFFSLDGAYTFSDRLQATAWASHTANAYQNATCVETGTPLGCSNTSASPVWSDKLANIDNSFGIGLRGQPTAQLKAGADYAQTKVRDSMMLVAETATGTASGITGFLPEINTRVTTLRLYADYALRRDSGVRVQYAHDRYATDDWTWQNWVYSDGTTVTQNPNQTVNFIGASLYFRF